jgi:hypothetical protein
MPEDEGKRRTSNWRENGSPLPSWSQFFLVVGNEYKFHHGHQPQLIRANTIRSPRTNATPFLILELGIEDAIRQSLVRSKSSYR